ncbi:MULTISPECIES: energy-coupling factor ABC transporter ATP-binding protein [Lactobacillus]|uniref:ABC transporter, ATP-binding protein n=1 Tax=Lactobacillus melliventris TaxID=1218507 RepID=A0A0F4LDR0_9LACO|nr:MULTISPECIES: ABC transporter ATP-binding protein [Lactobacillus]KJY55691.1 ABC transporter, ATP-binding protein [Lactobacillus melliventris]MBC6349265.1 ABC transporter ATP-binding protein [Lactobacillus melliventris]MCT6889060.1 energy-coupling factor ABC transporter ATP-binding protein [Lactobacillus sp.]RMC59873.1 ABC transporter ATP-binding protein [Lactobacillus sp. ESL0259]
MSLIELQHINYRYPLTSDLTIKDLSLKVEPGEVLGVIGSNGSGKTTVCNIMRGFIPAFYKGELEGKVIFEDKPLDTSNLGRLAQKIGYAFQNPFTQITGVKYTVYDEIGYGLENLSVPREEANEKVEQVIKLLNLEKIRNQNPYDLSGGQKQMVALASVIVLDPELIILDEPTSQLDPSSTLAVYNIVKNLKKQGKTIIIVDHKVDLLAQVCDEIAVIQDGQLVVKGETHHVFSDEKVVAAGGQIPEVSAFYLKKYPKSKQVPVTVDEAYEMLKEARA